MKTCYIDERFISMRNDLRHCPSEMIIGKSETEKTYFIQEEIKVVLKHTDDYVMIIDSTGEYHEFYSNMLSQYGEFRISLNNLSKYPQKDVSNILEDTYNTICSCQRSNGMEKRIWLFIDNADNFDFETIRLINTKSRLHNIIPTFSFTADHLSENLHHLFITGKSVIIKKCNENKITNDILTLLHQDKNINPDEYWNMWVIDGSVYNLV